MEEINKTTQASPPADQISTTRPPAFKTKLKLPHLRLIFLIILAFGIFLILILGLYYQGIIPPLKKELVTYTLRCGQKLRPCTSNQLKIGERAVFRIDVSAAFARFKDQKPNLCYYTNIEPTIDKFPPWSQISIKGISFYGGCINNTYDTYLQRSQFAFFIAGKPTTQKSVVKVFLTSSSTNTIETRITKEGVEIFNFK